MDKYVEGGESFPPLYYYCLLGLLLVFGGGCLLCLELIQFLLELLDEDFVFVLCF
jgi:hypothetical protein